MPKKRKPKKKRNPNRPIPQIGLYRNPAPDSEPATDAPSAGGDSASETSEARDAYWRDKASRRVLDAIFPLDMEQFDKAISILRSIPEQYRPNKAWIYLAEALCRNVENATPDRQEPAFREAMDCLEHVPVKDRKDPAWMANMLRAKAGLGDLKGAMKDVMAWRRRHLETASRNDSVGVEMLQAAESHVLETMMKNTEQAIYGDGLQQFQSGLIRIFGPQHKGPYLNYGNGDFYNAMWYFQASRSRRFGTLVTECTGPHGDYLPGGVYPTERFELILTIPAETNPFQSDPPNMWRFRVPALVTVDFLRLPPEQRLLTPPEGDDDNGRFRYTKFCAFLVTDPVWLPSGDRILFLPACGRTVRFLQLIPLFREELDWLQRYGLETLLPRLQENHIARPDRPSVLTAAEKYQLRREKRG